MNTYNDKNSNDEIDEEFTSKTQLKKDALALKKFGLQLSQLTAEKLNLLPISETTLKSILDYQKITTNLARKRQLMFVGKCLRNEDEDKIRNYLTTHSNTQLKAKTEQVDTGQAFAETLLSGGAEAVEKLIQDNSSLERQTLRQLVRNVNNAKVVAKKKNAMIKLQNYLNEFCSL